MKASSSIQILVLTALAACAPFAGQSQDVAPLSIAGRVGYLTYTSSSNGPPPGTYNVTAYDQTTFHVLVGPSTGLTGTYTFTKTATNTSLTILNFLVGALPAVRTSRSVFATPQSGTFTFTTTIAGQPSWGGGGEFEEVLYSTITRSTNEFVLSWLGGRPPYTVQCATNPAFCQWTLLQTVNTNILTVPAVPGPNWFRIEGRSASEN